MTIAANAVVVAIQVSRIKGAPLDALDEAELVQGRGIELKKHGAKDFIGRCPFHADKDSPNFIGVGKGEDKLRLKVNEILAAAKASGDLDKMATKWLGRPAGDLPN